MYKIIILIFLNIVILSKLFGQGNRSTISVIGGPVFNTTVLNVTEAGNNFINPLTESTSNTFVSIDDKKKANNWDIKVRLSQSIGNLTLDVMRTAGGSGTGINLLTGGTTWTRLSLTDVMFFSGKNDVQNVPVLFRIGGVSVVDAVGSKSFNLIFTVVDR